MTFWSTQTLQARLQNDDIVLPYCPDRTQESSHMLSMGDQYLVTSDPDQERSTESWIKDLGDKKSFIIPPGQFAFLLTEECLQIPENAIGFIAIASKQCFRGLVNVSGFHVDPGYQGKLILAVFNAGPKSVTVEKGDTIFRLWMANLDEEDRASRRTRGKEPLEKISSKIANDISGDMVSPQSLAIKFEKLNQRVRYCIFVAGVIFALCVPLLGSLIIKSIGQIWQQMLTGP